MEEIRFWNFLNQKEVKDNQKKKKKKKKKKMKHPLNDGEGHNESDNHLAETLDSNNEFWDKNTSNISP